jgi:hypothetical protein
VILDNLHSLEGLDGGAVMIESSVGFRVVLDGVPWTVLAPQRKTTAHLTSTYALRVTVTMHRRSEWRRSASLTAGPCVSLR